jgi:SAM-dependent methyltransferase
LHLVACANTELGARHMSDTATVRILDAGCGDGLLLAYLEDCLSQLHPRWRLELYGFDVVDHGVQQSGFMDRAVQFLSGHSPQVNWLHRVRGIGAADPWPFEDQSFDLVLSNQVLEHVQNHASFFREAHRVLAKGGTSVHLFPLKHYIYEGHLHLPWVHRIRSYDLQKFYISMLSRVGLGKYQSHKRESGISVEEFSERHADYMSFWTNYLTEAEALDIARRAGFRSSFRYTSDFYAQKIALILRRNPRVKYRVTGRGLWDSVTVKGLRYVSSVTLTCHKENKYST